MKISTKGRYGLRALVDLAANAKDEPIALATVARRQKLSLNYLEQVFGTLRKANIVKSMKGAGGGYLLAKDASAITVRDIFEALEGTFSITDTDELDEEQDYVKRAIRRLVWNRIDIEVNGFLEETTLEKLVTEYNQLQQSGNEMYYI
ncbi:MAG: Rrf2 family transcriptional regulator [Lachnospiraceae bacterium]|nr:Rrf2 family transcriptional regulator [Lachnospiraceae bacterium]